MDERSRPRRRIWRWLLWSCTLAAWTATGWAFLWLQPSLRPQMVKPRPVANGRETSSTEDGLLIIGGTFPFAQGDNPSPYEFWDLANLRRIATLPETTDELCTWALRPDGQMLALAYSTGKEEHWDLHPMKLKRRWQRQHGRGAQNLFWEPDGVILLCVDVITADRMMIRRFDSVRNVELPAYETPRDFPLAVIPSDKGRALLVLERDNEALQFLDTESGQEEAVWQFPKPTDTWECQPSISPNGRYVGQVEAHKVIICDRTNSRVIAVPFAGQRVGMMPPGFSRNSEWALIEHDEVGKADHPLVRLVTEWHQELGDWLEKKLSNESRATLINLISGRRWSVPGPSSHILFSPDSQNLLVIDENIVTFDLNALRRPARTAWFLLGFALILTCVCVYHGRLAPQRI